MILFIFEWKSYTLDLFLMFKSVKRLLMKKRKLWRKEDVEVGNEKMFNKNYFD